MIRLSKDQVLLLHSIVIKQSGGINGVKDYSLLDSALNTPFQTFDENDLYPMIQGKAAKLCYSIIKNLLMEIRELVC